MKGSTVQINWHDGKPVLTLDFHPISGLLATGGADFDIKLWLINSGQGEEKVPSVSYQNSLTYHGCSVNTLRFSRSGELLASGADGGELIIWKLHHSEASQTWKVHKSLSFHRKDVLDLQWSSDDAFLISGSVDNSCIIWDVNKGSVHQILDGHCHYVQGVAWDPLTKYVASLSSDRTCRIYMNKPQTKSKSGEKMNYVCQHVIAKADLQQGGDAKRIKTHLFHDETLPSFFRRLSWSPDGSFLLIPAGSLKHSSSNEAINTTYVFSRKDLSRPAFQLPGASKPVVVVRFCPIAFKLQGLSCDHAAGFFKLPYRLVFAVGSLNSVYIYDTEGITPIAVLAGLHYAAITDMSWSSNASHLAVSSQDGYCTLIEFKENELGEPVSFSDGKNPEECDEKKAVISKPNDLMIEARTKVGNIQPKEEKKIVMLNLDDLMNEAREECNERRGVNEKQDDLMTEAIEECNERRGVNEKQDDLMTEAIEECNERRGVNEKQDDLMTEARASGGNKSSNVEKAEEARGGEINKQQEETIKDEMNEQSEAKKTPTVVSEKPARKRITPMAIDP